MKYFVTAILKTRLEEEKLFLIREHDQDRDAYQKLLADYNALEQRHEVLEKEINRLQRGGGNVAGAKKGHQRSLSNASTASATSELPDDVSNVCIHFFSKTLMYVVLASLRHSYEVLGPIRHSHT